MQQLELWHSLAGRCRFLSVWLCSMAIQRIERPPLPRVRRWLSGRMSDLQSYSLTKMQAAKRRLHPKAIIGTRRFRLRPRPIREIVRIPRMRPTMKKILLRVPTVRRYLAEKYQLDAALTEAITERERYRAILQEKVTLLENVLYERNSLIIEQQTLKLRIANECRISQTLRMQRDGYRLQRDELAARISKLQSQLQGANAASETLLEAQSQRTSRIKSSSGST